MRVISRARLRQFWESRRHDARLAQGRLIAWEKLVKHCSWADWGELKQTFGSADRVGNCIVFDVANNEFRLISRINFDAGIVYVLKGMDHGQYDHSRWEDQCGCHEPPPRYPSGRA